MTQPNANGTAKERLATVPEAAKLLGISPEAVRTRLSRGTLEKRKGQDNTTYVVLPDDLTSSNDNITNDRTDPASLPYRLLEDQVRFLRAELERKDHLLAAALERIPAIEAPPDTQASSEPRESPQAPSEEPSDTQASQEEAEHSKGFWRRLFGG